MTVWRPSDTIPGGLEVELLVPPAKLPSNMRIVLAKDWVVEYSVQKNLLTVGPLPEVSLQELSSQVSSMTSSVK